MLIMLSSTLYFHHIVCLIVFALALLHGTRPVYAAFLLHRRTKSVLEDAKSEANDNDDPPFPCKPPCRPPFANAAGEHVIEDLGEVVTPILGSVLTDPLLGERSNTDALPDLLFSSRNNNSQYTDVYLEREVNDLEADVPVENLDMEELTDGLEPAANLEPEKPMNGHQENILKTGNELTTDTLTRHGPKVTDAP
ncbi:hypothetical protein JR316_0004163 [Psilocybe cubensis]|uniref:Uncharacterized protein n=1 Tax=Psilocybe cubensis TaxID=181762 RepID=A0ACB8H2P6_PSICU|nr:hypothetical protein JR316_0004163 [Psilocybe cubensis]KAH9482068.1 hypothetical protein JR316_0004163 [Psilocybe cubensis]